VNDFVDECRREWRRLRVPDPVADEMAAELAADLAEAENEGIPVDEVLGGTVSDPRSFAASWAAERGVVGSASSEGVAKKMVLSAAIAGLAAVAISGAILMIVASTSTSGTRQAIAPLPAQTAKAVWVTTRTGNTTTIAPPRFAVEQDTGDSSDDTRTVGLVLLIVGLAGIVPVALSWRLTPSGRRGQLRPRP
jgi:hypothetical protein